MRSIVRIETAVILCVVLSLILPIWASATITLLTMLAWEVWKGFHGDNPFYSDLLADISGSMLGAGLSWLTIISNTFV